MATITATDATVITPLDVLDYAYTRASRNVVLEPLGSHYPTVFLRTAQSKSGTLSLLFSSNSSARAAMNTLASVNRFHFQEPAAGEDWHFVVTGDLTNTKQTGVNYWIVSATVRAVPAP